MRKKLEFCRAQPQTSRQEQLNKKGTHRVGPAPIEPTVAIPVGQYDQDQSKDQKDNGLIVEAEARKKRRCCIIWSVVVAVLVVAAIVLGVVFGVVLKKDSKEDSSHSSSIRGTTPTYKVDIQWQAQTFNGMSFGFVGPYATDVTLKHGDEKWDLHNEFKVKLDVQGNGQATVKSEVHHICCAHELEAGSSITVDSGSWSSWGSIKTCKCNSLWYDHQIRAKVTMIGGQSNTIVGDTQVQETNTPEDIYAKERTMKPSYQSSSQSSYQSSSQSTWQSRQLSEQSLI